MEHRNYMVHIVFRRKDDKYKHLHHDVVLTQEQDAISALGTIAYKIISKNVTNLPDDFDYDAHNYTIGVPIEIR